MGAERLELDPVGYRVYLLNHSCADGLPSKCLATWVMLSTCAGWQWMPVLLHYQFRSDI